jgi:hypothetical protein
VGKGRHPPNAPNLSSFSSPSSLKIPSGADDPGFKLRYHHIALTKSRGVKEMNRTRIEALHAAKIPSGLFFTPPSSPGGAGDPPATSECRLDGGVQKEET